MWSIYLVTNKINGKMYVGQTAKEVRIRWRNHVYKANGGHRSAYFLSAIRKYGKHNFIVDTIGTSVDKEQANNMERLWIVLLQTNRPENGYNLTIGGSGLVGPSPEVSRKMSLAMSGSGGPKYRHDIKDEDVVRLYVDENKSLRQVAAILGTTDKTIQGRLISLDIPRRPAVRTTKPQPWEIEQFKTRLYHPKIMPLETRQKISASMKKYKASCN